VNKSNAQHAILFEAISLILAQDFSKDLLGSSVSSLGRFLTVKVGAWGGRASCMPAVCNVLAVMRSQFHAPAQQQQQHMLPWNHGVIRLMHLSTVAPESITP
jgi:hypothetical protein